MYIKFSISFFNHQSFIAHADEDKASESALGEENSSNKESKAVSSETAIENSADDSQEGSNRVRRQTSSRKWRSRGINRISFEIFYFDFYWGKIEKQLHNLFKVVATDEWIETGERIMEKIKDGRDEVMPEIRTGDKAQKWQK